MSLEETLAILGTLGNLGIQGSEAGTALRRLLTLSAAESEKFQKVFGVATKDAQGNARNLVDVLGEVAAATANMGTGDRAAAFNEVFGLLGITSASAIGKSVTDTRQLLGDIQKARGISAKTAADMDSGIGGAFRILKSSIEGVAIAIGESLDLSVTKMMNAISRALSGLTEWIGKNQEVVKKVALIVAGVVGVGAAFIGIGSAAGVAAFAVGGLASMFSLVGTAIGAVVAMIGALFTPLGLVVAAVAALGGYFIYSTGIAGQAIEYLKGVFETLKADTLKAFGAIANALSAGDITAAANVLWTYLKLQWVKGTTYLKGLWSDFTNYLSDVWGDSAYAIGDVLISALSGLANIWNSTLGFMADGWTILTTSVQKGWNSTIGFLKKGFIRLNELVDIAGDVSVQIGGVLINALAGVETAWVETIDYLADTWSVFVAQVKSMWNSTVGFLRKAWIKLKSLFDEDVNVEVEMAKIDKEMKAADTAEENKKQEAIADRMKRRDARKQQIEANRVQMQEGIKQQLEERRKLGPVVILMLRWQSSIKRPRSRTRWLMLRAMINSSRTKWQDDPGNRQSTIRPLVFRRRLIKCVKRLALPAKPVVSHLRIVPNSVTRKSLLRKPNSTLPWNPRTLPNHRNRHLQMSLALVRRSRPYPRNLYLVN